MRYTFNFPTHIRFGAGVLEELPVHLNEHGFSSPLIVSDAGITGFPFFKDLIQSLSKNKIKPTTFSEIAKNPVKANVISGVTVYNQNSCDCIIGFGGGASIDVARAIALKVNHHEDLFHYEDGKDGWKHVTNGIPYFIAIPTTSGTGSEVGRSTVISDDNTHEKKILFAPSLMAKVVYADPTVTQNLPAHITAETGMDALTHCIEAYLAKGFQPMCDGIALEGIHLIEQSLGHAVLKPTLEHRSNMMAAAMMGAVAFQKGLGVVHSMAHALSTHLDIHHGLANALMLPYGLRFNQDVCTDKYHTIASVLELTNENSEGLICYIQELSEAIGIPSHLSEIGVRKEDISTLSEISLKDVCHLSNPKSVSLEDFNHLFSEAL